MRSAVLAMVIATGCCVGDPTPLPGQAEAMAIIWNGIYGETRDPPPIYWRRDHCPPGEVNQISWCSFDDGGEEVSGLTIDTPWHIELGAPWGLGKLHNTALAHELLHASIGDPNHHSVKWALVQTAHDKLIAEGL